MTLSKFIQTADLSTWLEELSQKNEVITPGYEGETLLFKPFAPEREVIIDYAATSPPKEVLFPQSEILFDFTTAKDPENPGRVMVDVRENLPAESTVVFGGRPCDARGFTMFDRIYLNEKAPDIYYAARRNNTSFITIACQHVENTCFCHWMGSSPCDDEGSDVLAIPVQGGFYLKAVSGKGEQLLTSPLLKDGTEKKNEADTFCQERVDSMGMAPDLSGAPDKILKVFDDMKFWEGVSAKCLSCGACTYLCPSCYCFNISDEDRGTQGKRIRSWDNCMSAQFTMEASGHNPRPTKAHRLKNRVSHKFSYYPKIHGGVFSCCGCGRCIKSCPAGIDIRDIVLQAMNYTPETAGEQK